MLSANERLLKIATADAKTLARVDQILQGEDPTAATFRDVDCRTTTFADAAKRLNCSRVTVYGLVRDGRLDVIEMNGTRRITVASIVEFASGKRPADAATIARIAANAAKRGGTDKRKRGAA